MALLHQATITPSKLELVRDWLPTQSWYLGEAGAELVPVAAYRFDDPDGEVGVETILTSAPDGAVFQVPVTYRDAPLEGADEWLIGTTQHSVLGKRWVYDGLGDPVYLAAVTFAIRTGGKQADLLIEIDGEMITREPTARVKGSGSAKRGDVAIEAAPVEAARIEVVRYPVMVQPLMAQAGDDVLTGSWPGQLDDVVLVRLER